MIQVTGLRRRGAPGVLRGQDLGFINAVGESMMSPELYSNWNIEGMGVVMALAGSTS